MKKIIILLVLGFSMPGFSQSVTVNTTTYTVDQLVNSVLINSPCVSGTNVASKTGTTFGSTNGIGYFESTNPNFPFQKGVVLTTGDVTKVPSPNTSILSDGNTSWTGDSDLEANLLSQSGITIKSVNASYIEFDFKPKTSNFDFEFIFASEEYGTSQCNFSDAFAFLLKDLTIGGSNKNLAVVPAPALPNTPISVQTIRDNLYNTNCPSANAGFFGSFNGVGFGPAINFNGQTVKMIASATGLDVTHTYHIKLVIADGGDNVEYDSAIFFNANSFNIGQNVLGLDYSAENNSAICSGSPLPTLSAAGLSPGTTYVWKKAGVALSPAQTGSTLDLNSISPLQTAGIQTYSVTYTEPGCVAITDDIIVEVYPKLNFVTTLPDIYTCDTGAANYSFDLTKNTSIIMAGINQATTAAGISDDLPASTIVTYHLTNADAVANTGVLSSPFTILNSENGKTIYARVSIANSSCFELRSFQLKIVAKPYIAAVPAPTTLCAKSSTSLTAAFNLTSQIATILGPQSSVYNVISFYTSSTSANSKTGNLTITAAGDLTTATRTIWVRMENISNTGCYVTTSFQLNVTPLPKVDALTDVVVCTSYTLPALVNAGAEYRTATKGAGTQLLAGNVINTTKTIYVYNNSGVCSNEDPFKVTIANLPSITPATATYCTEYKLPALAYGNYYTQSGGDTTVGNVKLAAGTIINTAGPNKIYVWFEDTTVTPSCTKETSFTVTIIPFTPLPDYDNQFSCNSYTLLADSNGGVYYSGPGKGLPVIPSGTVISSTTPIYVYKESGTSPLNCNSEKSFTVYIGISSITPPTDVNSCSTYTLPDLVVGEYRTAAAGGGSVVAEGTAVNATTTLWYHVPGQSCTDNLSFTVTVKIAALPVMTDTDPQCDVYYLPAVAHSGNYYTKPLGAGIKRPVGYPITSTQTIYFYDKAPVGSCYVQESFLITINSTPNVDARPVEVLQCNQSYFLDDLKDGEYYEFPGGPSVTNPVLPPGYEIKASKKIYVYAGSVLPNTCFAEYSIDVTIVNTKVNPIEDIYACDTYTLPAITGQGDYYTATGGPKGTGVKLVPPYAPITTTTTFYVYAEDNNRIACSDEDVFTVTIYNTPVVAPISPIVVCGSYALPALIPPATKYFVSAGGPNGNNTEKFVGDLITSSTTIYAYAGVGTSTTKICYDEKPLVITIKPAPNPIADVFACDSYTLPAITGQGDYYTGPNGTGVKLVPPYAPITTTTTIYIYSAEDKVNMICLYEDSFTVTIYNTPVVAPISPVVACESYTLPALIPPATKYFVSPGGPNGNNTEKFAGDLITSSTTIYAYADVGTSATKLCYDEEPLVITIKSKPEPVISVIPICVDIDSGVKNDSYASSNYIGSQYSFDWKNEAGTTVSTTYDFSTKIPGKYTLTVTDLAAGCPSVEVPFTVLISSRPAKVTFITSGWFSENQSITVEAVPYPGYESNFIYTLDDDQSQTTPVFTNIRSGSHTISVSDANGCGSTPISIPVKLISSPKSFTPNGDTHNDEWEIKGLQNQDQAQIVIFDRYGKVIKKLSKIGDSWDGSFNGLPLPADDYWFVISYLENGIAKEFRSHFSLKR